MLNAIKFSAENGDDRYWSPKCLLAQFYYHGIGLERKRDMVSAEIWAKKTLIDDCPQSFKIMGLSEKKGNTEKICMWFFIYDDLSVEDDLFVEDIDGKILKNCNDNLNISQKAELLARKCKNNNYKNC